MPARNKHMVMQAEPTRECVWGAQTPHSLMKPCRTRTHAHKHTACHPPVMVTGTPSAISLRAALAPSSVMGSLTCRQSGPHNWLSASAAVPAAWVAAWQTGNKHGIPQADGVVHARLSSSCAQTQRLCRMHAGQCGSRAGAPRCACPHPSGPCLRGVDVQPV